MAITLTSTKKAPVLDQDGHQLQASSGPVFSSDQNIVGIEYAAGPIFAIGRQAGTATITATRNADAAVATLTIEVIGAAPFVLSLGAEVPA